MAEVTFRDFAAAIMQKEQARAADLLTELLGMDGARAIAAASHFAAQMATQGQPFMMKAMGLRTAVTSGSDDEIGALLRDCFGLVMARPRPPRSRHCAGATRRPSSSPTASETWGAATDARPGYLDKPGARSNHSPRGLDLRVRYTWLEPDIASPFPDVEYSRAYFLEGPIDSEWPEARRSPALHPRTCSLEPLSINLFDAYPDNFPVRVFENQDTGPLASWFRMERVRLLRVRLPEGPPPEFIWFARAGFMIRVDLAPGQISSTSPPFVGFEMEGKMVEQTPLPLAAQVTLRVAGSQDPVVSFPFALGPGVTHLNGWRIASGGPADAPSVIIDGPRGPSNRGSPHNRRPLVLEISKAPKTRSEIEALISGETFTLDDMVHVGLLRKEDERYRIGLNLLLVAYQERILDVSERMGRELAAAFLARRSELEALAKSHVQPHIGKADLLYIILGCFSLDWDGLDLTEQHGYRAGAQRTIDGHSFTPWAKEKGLLTRICKPSMRAWSA